MSSKQRSFISALTLEVEAYQKADAELAKCHHYVFGVPLPIDAPSFEYVVFGLNPGEQAKNWEDFPAAPTKETIDFDWLEQLPKRTRSSIRWRSLCAELCDNRPVLMNDFFFWSTKSTGRDFEERFGHRFLDSRHFEFCRYLNLKMIDGLSLRAVVAPGLTHAPHFARLYGLNLKTTEPIKASNGRNLIVEYERAGVPWIFTKHWTGSFGFSKEQRTQIRDYITAAGSRRR